MKPPAYIFTGLLESGKTSFIKEVLSDPNFTLDEKTLLIRCEEGIEEYDEAFLEKYNVVLVDVEDEENCPLRRSFGQLRRKNPTA